MIADPVDGPTTPSLEKLEIRRQVLHRLGFAGFPGALDELQAEHLHPVAARSQAQPEGSGGFALAIAGVDDHQPFADSVPGAALGARRTGRLGHTCLPRPDTCPPPENTKPP